MLHIVLRHCRTLAIMSLLHASIASAQEIRVSAKETLQTYRPAFEKVIRSAGFIPHFSFYPGERSLKMLQDGEVDLEYTRTKTAVSSISAVVTLIGPVGCIEGVAYTRSDSPIKIRGLTDLNSGKLVIPFIHKTAVEFAKNNRLDAEIVTNRESMFMMIMTGRFEIAVDSRLDGQVEIYKQKLNNKIIQNGPVLFSEPIYLAMNNIHRDWAPRVQKAIDEAIKNGSWQESVSEINIANGIPKDLGITCLKSPAKR